MSAPTTRERVALVLAIGLAVALNLFVLAVLWDALVNDKNAGLSENATTILTIWVGGIVGVLGALFGYRIGSTHDDHDTTDTDTRPQTRRHKARDDG